MAGFGREPMTDPIGWINHWRPKDAWYYLATPERRNLQVTWEDIRHVARADGARLLGQYESRANSPFARFSIWEFTRLSTLTAMLAALEDAEYYRYFVEDNVLGRRTSEPYANYDEAARLTEESA